MRTGIALVSLASLCLVFAASCGGSTESSTPPAGTGGAGGASGGAGGGSAGTGAGTGGANAGSAGAGTGGATAGAGGSTAGAAGSTAGAAGSSAGAAGSTAGAAGSTAGAAGSTAGSGGSAGSGGAVSASPECASDTDCQLEDDCCACAGLPKSEMIPACTANCKVSSCTAFAITAARCVAGQCVAGAECNTKKALCKSLPPACPAGQVISVVAGCWGPCIAPDQCTQTTTCDDCTKASLACVQYVTQLGPEIHCVAVPSVCTGATCACMGPDVCVNGFGLCQEGMKNELLCECPAC